MHARTHARPQETETTVPVSPHLPGLSRSEDSISQSASGREICIHQASQEFRPRGGTAVAKPECEPMLSGQLVVRLFSMASRICMSRGSAGSGVIGPVEAAIRTKLEQALNPEVLELRNESGGHAVPPGSETHFRVAVVSSRFEGLSPLQRHRLVHAALSEELAGPVHALAIQARTPAQWKENPQLDTSPPCLGGSKKSRN